MPRPQRDYNVALKQDIEKLDARIQALLIEREKKVRMLAVLNEPVDVDLQSVVGSGRAQTARKRRT